MIGFTGDPSDNLIPCAMILILLGLAGYGAYQQRQARSQPTPTASPAQVSSGSG